MKLASSVLTFFTHLSLTSAFIGCALWRVRNPFLASDAGGLHCCGRPFMHWVFVCPRVCDGRVLIIPRIYPFTLYPVGYLGWYEPRANHEG